VLFVFAFARLATAIRFTPGGAGVVEAVLIGGLLAFGADPAQATASVLVFRALTWLLPVPLGLATYLGWRWRQHRRTARAPVSIGGAGAAPPNPPGPGPVPAEPRLPSP
jgi:putative heme transporter